MLVRTDSEQQSALVAMEATVAAARAGFACLFSTSDEYESALISERRALGRYGTPSRWPVAAFIALSLLVAGAALALI